MVYSINKKSGGDLTMQYMPGISDIVAYGTHLQPFPGVMCMLVAMLYFFTWLIFLILHFVGVMFV